MGADPSAYRGCIGIAPLRSAGWLNPDLLRRDWLFDLIRLHRAELEVPGLAERIEYRIL